MSFIKVDKKIDLSTSKKQKAYINSYNIIALVTYRDEIEANNYMNLIYRDITNPEKWASHSEYSEDLISKYNLIQIDSKFDKIYKSVFINPLQINYIINSEDDNVFYIFSTSNIKFSHYDIKFDLIKKLSKTQSFINFLTPLKNECWININKINSIEIEDYTIINPLLIEKYLNEGKLMSKSQLFYIIFEDSSILTILDNNLLRKINDIQN